MRQHYIYGIDGFLVCFKKPRGLIIRFHAHHAESLLAGHVLAAVAVPPAGLRGGGGQHGRPDLPRSRARAEAAEARGAGAVGPRAVRVRPARRLPRDGQRRRGQQQREAQHPGIDSH